MMVLYLKTTTDEYELPIAVAASPGELAELTGITEASAASIVSRLKNGKKEVAKCYHIVEVEDDEMNDAETINRIYRWADKNHKKYYDAYQQGGSASAMRTFERYDDICDICIAAEKGVAEENKTKKHSLMNQMAILDSLHDMRKVAPGKKFGYAEVEEWMRKMMV